MPKSQKKPVAPVVQQPVEKPAKAKPVFKKANKEARGGSKQSMLITLLERSAGATVDEMTKATGWQGHSVLGAISGILRKRLGLTVESAMESRGRVYRIAGGRR